jgi:L-asparagine transporter-like permease
MSIVILSVPINHEHLDLTVLDALLSCVRSDSFTASKCMKLLSGNQNLLMEKEQVSNSALRTLSAII